MLHEGVITLKPDPRQTFAPTTTKMPRDTSGSLETGLQNVPRTTQEAKNDSTITMRERRQLNMKGWHQLQTGEYKSPRKKNEKKKTKLCIHHVVLWHDWV